MVPKRLKEARQQSKISQEKLAEMIGLDGMNIRSRLSNYEVGRFTPSFELIVKIAKALDYPESYFYTLDDHMAETILLIHRNRLDPTQNPYRQTYIEMKKLVSQLNDIIKKNL